MRHSNTRERRLILSLSSSFPHSHSTTAVTGMGAKKKQRAMGHYADDAVPGEQAISEIDETLMEKFAILHARSQLNILERDMLHNKEMQLFRCLG